jgi:hypothetical protein
MRDRARGNEKYLSNGSSSSATMRSDVTRIREPEDL